MFVDTKIHLFLGRAGKSGLLLATPPFPEVSKQCLQRPERQRAAPLEPWRSQLRLHGFQTSRLIKAPPGGGERVEMDCRMPQGP